MKLGNKKKYWNVINIEIARCVKGLLVIWSKNFFKLILAINGVPVNKMRTYRFRCDQSGK